MPRAKSEKRRVEQLLGYEPSIVAGVKMGEYAASRGITLLVGNYRWIETAPEIVPRLVAELPGLVAAAPDTLNWPDEATRRRGLALAFPHAVTADFKIRELRDTPPKTQKHLFDLGHRSGFRGPWCIEHTHAQLATLLSELRLIARHLKTRMLKARQSRAAPFLPGRRHEPRSPTRRLRCTFRL